MPNAPVGQATASLGVDLGDLGVQPIDFPDPFVLRVEGPAAAPFYAYSTQSGLFTAVQVIKSTDLTNWTWVGDAFGGGGGTRWAQLLFGSTWAPSVLERPANPPSQRFVLYYTAKSIVASSAGYQCIGRAVSAAPEGPFIDDNATPLICTTSRGGSVDPNPIVVNGSVYLLWQSAGIAAINEPSRIWSVPLTADGLTIAGTAKQLLETLGWSWEPPVVEGPSMMPAPGGGFLLFYSAGGPWQTAGYKVAVAWCATPTKACTRLYLTPVLATRGTMAGPGGESVFQDQAGNWFMVFHAWTSPFVGYPNTPDPRFARSVRILPISFPNGDRYPKVG